MKPLAISDPRIAPESSFFSRFAPLLNDKRDGVVLALMAHSALVACAGIALFFSPWSLLYVAPLYWLFFGSVVDRFTLMLHCTSHRQLFQNQYRALNWIIPVLLGPFFGQTPHAYFVHHMGMHHREENMEDDLSSTLRFRRNRFDHWLRYWGRFLVIGLFELVGYFKSRKQSKLLRRLIWGEGVYWTLILILAVLNPAATFVVFIAPLIAVRTLMMMGNWAQHSFISPEHPSDPYGASITCINTRYNRRCFNDGYHILHHVQPRCHWTEHPIEFEKSLDEYGRRDAIVFDGLDYFQVWLYLMLGRWKKLAAHFVALPLAPVRSSEEVVAFLKQRVEPLAPQAEPLAPPAEPLHSS